MKLLNTKTKKIVAASIVVLLVALAWFGRSKFTREKVVYRERKVGKGSIAITVLATGTVQPENRLEIKAPIAGRLEKVLTDEGHKVRKGQIIAWMSSTERAALIDAASAKGPAELARWEELYQPTPVLAPLNGTIILRNAEDGQTITSSDAIFAMSDRLTVKAQVDETDIAKIKLKQGAEIILDAYSQDKVPAKVDQIAFEAKTVNNVTTYLVDVLPDSTPDYMRSGMTANVSFYIEQKDDILVVPNDAIKIVDGSAQVMTRNPSGENVDTKITVGLTDGKTSEVTSGLNEGDTILTAKFSLNDPSKSKSSSPFSPLGRPRTGGGGGGGGRAGGR